MRIFDSHAHYDDKRFDEEFPGGALGALSAAKNAGVLTVVNSGACLETSKNSILLSELSENRSDIPRIYASVGIHPSETGCYEKLQDAIDTVRELASHRNALAIGEIGLDYHYPDTDKAAQHELFVAQMELARELKMPVVIHSRDAHGDTFEVLRKYTDLTLMLHCYSGSAEMARQYSEMGFSFSFGGVITFKNAEKSREAAAAVPKDRLLLETDCPYLAPTPHRGEINHSGFMPLTAAALGAAVGLSQIEAAELTYCNAMRFFGIE